MTVIEICLILAGLVLMVGSFFITEKLSPKELDKIAELSKEEISHIVKKETAASEENIKDQMGEKLEEALLKLERESDKETNEKIMAISEYSDTVLESINKSHNEIMFLYSMLGDKHKEITDFANGLQSRVEELQKNISEKALLETLKNVETEHGNSIEFMDAVAKTNEEMLEEVRAIHAQDGDAESEETARSNNNERILELRAQGMNEVAIAKELGLGLGEVRLVIDLYEKEES